MNFISKWLAKQKYKRDACQSCKIYPCACGKGDYLDPQMRIAHNIGEWVKDIKAANEIKNKNKVKLERKEKLKRLDDNLGEIKLTKNNESN